MTQPNKESSDREDWELTIVKKAFHASLAISSNEERERLQQFKKRLQV